MLLLVQELALLRNFEAKDRALALKLNKSQAEKADVVAAITDCQGKLLVKKKVRWVRHPHDSVGHSTQASDAHPPLPSPSATENTGGGEPVGA